VPSIEQIRQEYREAVASAIEGRDDLEAWNRVRVSLANAVFSAWLSSACKTAKGIPVDPVEKVLYAKSGCGAGSEGNEGFQEGNTCAGEGASDIGGEVKKATEKEYRNMGVKRLDAETMLWTAVGHPTRLNILDDEKNKGLVELTKGVFNTVHGKKPIEQFMNGVANGDKEITRFVNERPDLRKEINDYVDQSESILQHHQKMIANIAMARSKNLTAEKMAKKVDEIHQEYGDAINPVVAKMYVANNNINSIFVAKALTPNTYTNYATEERIDENGIHHDKSSMTFKNMEDYVDKKLTLVDAKDCEFHIVTSAGSKANEKYPHAQVDARLFEQAIPEVKKILEEVGVKLPKVLDIGFGTRRMGKPTEKLFASFMSKGWNNTQPSQINVPHRAKLHLKMEGRKLDALSKPESGVYWHSHTHPENPMISDIIHEVGHVLHSIALQSNKSELANKAIKDYSKLDKSNIDELVTHATSSEPITAALDNWTMYYRNSIRKGADKQLLSSGYQITKKRLKAVSGRVSRYAETNPVEFVAETFSGLVFGKKYDDEVMRVYEALGGVVPEK